MDVVNLQKTHSQMVSSTIQDSNHKSNHNSNHNSNQIRTAGAQGNTSDSKQDEVISVARKFEALMLHSMLKSMRATIIESELTGSNGQDMYRDMMDQEIAKNISESGGFGIQAVLARQLGATMGDSSQVQSNAQTASSREGDNPVSRIKLEQLQQYQKMSGANDLMFNSQTSLID